MARKKQTGILGVSFSNRGKRGRGKKGLDAMSNMGRLGEKAFKSWNKKGRGSSRLGAVSDWFARVDYLEERRRVMEDMENNPQAIAREIRANRVWQFSNNPVRQVLDMITRAAMRVQRRETKLDDGREVERKN